MILGAGRATKEDVIDMGVGIVLNKKVGDKLSTGDVLATIYTNGKSTEQAISIVLDAYSLTKNKVSPRPTIIETIR